MLSLKIDHYKEKEHGPEWLPVIDANEYLKYILNDRYGCEFPDWTFSEDGQPLYARDENLSVDEDALDEFLNQ